MPTPIVFEVEAVLPSVSVMVRFTVYVPAVE
jgi:hypothetical protein